MKKINVKINNIPVTVNEGATILEAAAAAGITIPTLCYVKGLCNEGSCRVCVVEVKGARFLTASCVTAAAEGMEIFTSTPKVLKSRKKTIELLMSDHHQKCLSCVRCGQCELQDLAKQYDCNEDEFSGQKNDYKVDDLNEFLVRDNNKCVLCRRCVAVCNKVQSTGVIGAVGRGHGTSVACPFDKPLSSVPCVACGQCINVCPTGALRERDNIEDVKKLLNDPEKYVIAGTAPAVRAALGEEFGQKIGTDVEGKMVAALHKLGFDNIFDVNMTADMTIMEEGYEFLHRLKDKTAALPMITSCSPGWIRFIEYYYPELLGHLSSCKSPQQMFGAIMKTYYAKKINVDPKNIAVVTIMPCVAKKSEIKREHQNASGYPDIDAVLTTREFARLIKSYGIDFNALKNRSFDNPIGEGTSAGLIFGASGGVMEAALRTISEVITNKPLEKLDFTAVRGTQGIKTASLTIDNIPLKVCVASGLANARKVLEDVKSGKADYQFIEIMSCPGGCINGGGQPIVPSKVRNAVSVPELRAKVLYNKDKTAKIRKSHENPVVQTLYKEFFDKPNSHLAHEILHTQYKKREKYS